MATADDRLIAKSKKLWEESQNHERLLQFLRRGGMSKLDSIKAIRLVCGVGLGEAKRIVNASEVWRDTLRSTVALHKVASSAITGTRS